MYDVQARSGLPCCSPRFKVRGKSLFVTCFALSRQQKVLYKTSLSEYPVQLDNTAHNAYASAARTVQL